MQARLKKFSDLLTSELSEMTVYEGIDAVEVLFVLLKYSAKVARIAGCSAGRFIFHATNVWVAVESESEVEKAKR